MKKKARTARIEIRLTPELKEELENVSQFTRRTVTSLCDEALEDLVKKYPDPEAAKRA